MQKLFQLAQELKSNLKPNINDTLMHCQETPSTCKAIDNQVCFHRWLFANPVKQHWCITGTVEPLGSTNQSWLAAKLLPMSVLIYPVDCVHFCHLLRTQHHCLFPNDWENPPLAFPSTPTTPISLPPTIHDTYDITAVVKNSS